VKQGTAQHGISKIDIGYKQIHCYFARLYRDTLLGYKQIHC